MLFCQFLKCRFHGWHARVALFVDTVTKAHYQVLVGELFFRPGFSFRWVVDLQHIVHDGLVGTTMQRALERADSSHYCRVGIGHGRGHYTASKCRGVERVLGVENQRLIESFDIGAGIRRRSLFITEDHPQEVFCKPLLA